MGQILTTRTDGLGHARNVAALHSAQAAFEAAPELLDDDTPSEDDCRSQAEDELLTTAEPLADWIAKRCDCDQGRAPIDTARFEDVDLIDCDRVPMLLACIVAGDYAQGVFVWLMVPYREIRVERSTAGIRDRWRRTFGY